MILRTHTQKHFSTWSASTSPPLLYNARDSLSHWTETTFGYPNIFISGKVEDYTQILDYIAGILAYKEEIGQKPVGQSDQNIL